MYNYEINVSLANNNRVAPVSNRNNKNNSNSNSYSATPEITRGSTKQTKAERMNELAVAVRSGNMESFDELYNLGLHKAIAIAMKKGATQEEALDMAQEAMLKLYRNIDTVYAVSNWLETTVTRKVIDAYRKKAKIPAMYELDAPMDNSKGDSMLRSETVADTRTWVNPDAVVERDVKAEVLAKALPHIMSLLSDKHQEVLRYALIENKKQDEIASLMGISRSTVAAHLRNAKIRFQKEFAKHYDVSLFGLKSAYELETDAVSSSFLIFIAELCSAIFFCFFQKIYKQFTILLVDTSVTTKHNTKQNAFANTKGIF